MRFATIRTSRGLRLHVKGGEGYVDLADATGNETLATLNGLAASGGDALEAARAAATQSGQAYEGTDFGPLTPNPPRILCLGVNYADHAIEGGRAVPTWPESFVRGAGSVIGAYDDLVKPALSSRLDYEAELAIIIGRGGRYIKAEDAYDAILGYSVMNDGSAREWQRAATQWTPGKNFEGTMPIGPELVTNDEVDVTDLSIRSLLNGDVMQDSRTSHMIVSVSRAVEYFSSFTTLRPGDVIASGTPGGVGFARTPPVWLTPGDTIEVVIEGIGAIANKVVAEEGAPADWPWMPLKADTTSF
ncbi:MAG: fumarylacetoacetate hydrolase family protein [Acidobacteria bacterium]|nr:fumarylacetoacetate hydrolase family protein [Acidobacteriota bacterium]